jgi:hypothetical protein
MSWAQGKRGHLIFSVRVRLASGREREFEARGERGTTLTAMDPVPGVLW